MKNKLIAAILCCVLMLTGVFCAAPANAASDTADEIDKLIGGIVAFKTNECGAQSIQEWIDTGLSDNAGGTAESYILSLHQSGEVYDYSGYSLSLLRYLHSSNISSASSRQKYALSLMAANCRNEYITNVLDDSVGELGIMSWVFGLHLVNNGVQSDKHNAESIIAQLLSMQLPDGGWAVRGEVSDVDVTSMTIQALAPHCGDENVKAAVDKALNLISVQQLSSGAFSSYGIENAESTAQVIIALSALGIDCRTDERFAKDGRSALDGLLQFRLEDGSFAHEPDGAYSHMATGQSLNALISLKRQCSGQGSLYVLDPQPDNTVVFIPGASDSDTESKPSDSETDGSTNVKGLLCAVIAAAAIAVSAVLFLLKKKNPKNYIVIVATAAVFILIVLSAKIQCASDYYGDNEPQRDVIGTVTMTIRCDTIADRKNSEYVPADGIILDLTGFDISEGYSVYDVLCDAAKKYGIHMENEGSSGSVHGMVYISGINHIYEFDYGELSGWMYRVNGGTPSVGCGNYILSDGDNIEWLYTCELGEDLK